jgi:hypothetical protein
VYVCALVTGQTLDVVVEAFTSVSVFVVGSEHLLHAACMKTIRTRTD